MNATLWGLQLFFAVLFLMHAVLHAFPPKPLRDRLADEAKPRMRLLANVSEAVGALGLVLPALLLTATWLVPFAALGLLALMIAAAGFHLSRREFAAATFPSVLAFGLAFLAYQRAFVTP